MRTAKHYINGNWIESVRGQTTYGDILNPATSEWALRYCDGTREEAEMAVQAARAAFEKTSWASTPRVREQVLLDFASALQNRKEEIADVIVEVNGKLRREALGEILAGVSELRYYAGLARNLYGRILQVEPGCFSSLEREPAGVAAIILPWNAPVTLLVRSLAPALAAGCATVIKPAHQTSLVNNLVLECLVGDERLPKGIVNSVIESGAAVSGYLCESPDVDVISFTGSTRVGKIIAEKTAPTLKRLSLELGGKAPAVVFSDCDISATVQGVVAGGLVMAGQQCTAISRVLVEHDIYEAFAEKLLEALKNIKVGMGSDPSSDMGCVIDLANRDRLADLVENRVQSERVLLKGNIPDGDLKNGAFISPSLIEVQDLNSPFIQQELFGPILVIEKFSGDEEALRRANATRYSLAASVWTRDATKARTIASKLKFGTVWHNAHNRLFAEAETGGYGDSGYGKLHGIEGLNDFLQTKHFYFEAR